MWMPIRIYCKLYPWPTASGLRCMLWRYEKENQSLPPYAKRIGKKRILIEDKQFQEWISNYDDNVSDFPGGKILCPTR